jgi:hypothetical protein
LEFFFAFYKRLIISICASEINKSLLIWAMILGYGLVPKVPWGDWKNNSFLISRPENLVVMLAFMTHSMDRSGEIPLFQSCPNSWLLCNAGIQQTGRFPHAVGNSRVFSSFRQ